MSSKKVINLGMDIGNKNLKVCGSENNSHEIAIAYKEISKYDYENESVGEGMEKVKYNNKYYFVGLQCQGGIGQNKGAVEYREIANMFKLIGLARELRKQGVHHADFNIVTGTPVLDWDAYKDGYKDLMLSKDSNYETIELNGVEYTVRVLDCIVTKQSACIAPTIPNWKEQDFILVDLGGGTLDLAYFQQGTKKEYDTVDFSLNEILADLGNKLNSHGLGLPRPNSLDSNFINLMENIISDGMYRKETSITIENNQVNLRDFTDDYMQEKIDKVLEEIKIKLRLSNTDSKYIYVFYLGGGAKLLQHQLNKNKTFGNVKVLQNPEFANVVAYQKMANSKRWE